MTWALTSSIPTVWLAVHTAHWNICHILPFHQKLKFLFHRIQNRMPHILVGCRPSQLVQTIGWLLLKDKKLNKFLFFIYNSNLFDVYLIIYESFIKFGGNNFMVKRDVIILQVESGYLSLIYQNWYPILSFGYQTN